MTTLHFLNLNLLTRNQGESLQNQVSLVLFDPATLFHWIEIAFPGVLHWLRLQELDFLVILKVVMEKQSLAQPNQEFYLVSRHFIANKLRYNYAILCTYFPLNQTNQTQVLNRLHLQPFKVLYPWLLELCHEVTPGLVSKSSLLKFFYLKDTVH